MSKKEELEALKLELKNRTEARQASLDSAGSEIKQLTARLAAFQRNLTRQQSLLEDVLSQTTAELKKFEAAPPSPRREHNVYLFTIRREVAVRQIEFIQLLLNFNPANKDSIKAFQANQVRLEALKVESKFLGQEYTIVNYRPVVAAIEEYLGNPGGASTGRLGTGPIGGQPSRLQQARAGTGPLSSQAAQPRPGVARPLAGQKPPLARPQTQGTPQRSATGPLSGGTGPLSGGTGPLNGGTGRLAAARGASQEGPHRVVGLLRDARLDADMQRHLQTAVQQFKEIDEQMTLLRGPQPAVLAVNHLQAVDLLNKVNGKIYYLKRTLSNLGPLAEQLAFEPEETDAAWDEFVAKQAMAFDPTEAKPTDDKGLTGKLKSFFNLG